MKILHTADWHLDSPFSGRSPEQRGLLNRALRQIPEKIAELCKRECCDLVLLAGDIFDGEYTRSGYEAVYSALEECAVPVFVSPGNHDPIGPGCVWQEERWPENVHIFRGGMESVAIPALDCRVYGAAFQSMDCEPLLEGFQAQGQERFCIGVLHGDATNANSPCNAMTAAQIRDSGLDYLALGHIHKTGMFHAGATVCAWPGCPMGRGFDETGERGVYITELTDGECTPRFVALNTLRFQEMTVETGENAVEALEAVLPGFGSWDFYRITLEGSGEGKVEEILSHFQHIPNMTLRDARQEPMDIWAVAGEDSLQGHYFALLKQAMENSDEKTRHQIRLAGEISRKLLDGREVTLP